MLMRPEIQLEILYSKAVKKYPKKYQKFLFSSFRTTDPPEPDLCFPPEIISGAHSENGGHLPPDSQVLLKGTIWAGKGQTTFEK